MNTELNGKLFPLSLLSQGNLVSEPWIYEEGNGDKKSEGGKNIKHYKSPNIVAHVGRCHGIFC